MLEKEPIGAFFFSSILVILSKRFWNNIKMGTMKIIKQICVLTFLLLMNACNNQRTLSQVDFLIGKWKVEGKERYERWIKTENKLIGEAFKISNGEEKVSEIIEIIIQNNQIVYTPTVFDQNEGKGIPFELKSSADNVFSFENSAHDFPKKIQYEILSATELFVSVLGDNEKGFSYKLIKQI